MVEINSDLAFDMIDAISKVTSKKQKMNMMLPELEKYFVYAYDPFKTYGLTRSDCVGGAGRLVFSESVWNLFDHLTVRNLTGKKAQAYVDSTITALSIKSSILFRRILAKDLRCGVSIKSINQVYGDIIQDGITMQPKEYKPRLLKLPTYVSHKLRGCRGYYRHRDNTIYSRRGKPYYGLDHITNALWPMGHDFDGELLVPGIPFEEGVGFIKSKKKTPNVHYCLFDAPATGIELHQRIKFYQSATMMIPSWIVACHNKLMQSEKEILIARDTALENGYEGIVLKNPNSLYKPGHSSEWLKIKELADPIDLEVIELYEGKGKYKGMMGGAIAEFKNKRVNIGGGWSDDERKYYYDNPNELIGKIIETTSQEKTKHGSLRNPNKKRIREDK